MSNANIEGMAVCVQLVFACEAHRYAWLERNGLFTGKVGEARLADYDRRSSHPVLTFLVANEPPVLVDGAGRPRRSPGRRRSTREAREATHDGT